MQLVTINYLERVLSLITFWFFIEQYNNIYHFKALYSLFPSEFILQKKV